MARFAKFAVTVLALAPATAAAHPDHTTGGEVGLFHIVSDPFHVAVIGIAVIVALALRGALRHRSLRASARSGR